MSRLILILFSLLILVSVCFSDTPVNNPISQDETWILSGSPYIINPTTGSYIEILNGAVVTIEQGVTVIFDESDMSEDENYSIVVSNGNLSARGATFTSGANYQANPVTRAAGDWGSITFNVRNRGQTVVYVLYTLGLNGIPDNL